MNVFQNMQKDFLKEEIKKYCNSNGDYIPDEWSEENLINEFNKDKILTYRVDTPEELEDYIYSVYYRDIEYEFQEKILNDYEDFLYKYSLYNENKPFTKDEINDLKEELIYDMGQPYYDSPDILAEARL